MTTHHSRRYPNTFFSLRHHEVQQPANCDQLTQFSKPEDALGYPSEEGLGDDVDILRHEWGWHSRGGRTTGGVPQSSMNEGGRVKRTWR